MEYSLTHDPSVGLVIHLLVSGCIGSILLIASLGLIPRLDYKEKLSSYECGFEPLSGARQSFDVRFFLVAVLFIVFDLEVVCLFGWVISLSELSLGSYSLVFVFLVVLGLGLLYEWLRGCMDWE